MLSWAPPVSRAACGLRCDERLLEVTGQGRVSARSTLAVLRATVETRQELNVSIPASTTASPASVAVLHALLLLVSNRTAATAAVVTAYLLSLPARPYHLSHLTTSALSLSPTYQYRDGQQRITGYSSSLSLSLRVNSSTAGEVIAGMLERGISRYDSIHYEVAAAAIRRGRAEAIRRAVQDAVSQAEAAVEEISAERAVSVDRRELQVVSMSVIGVTAPAPESFDISRPISMFSHRAGLIGPQPVLPILSDDKSITAAVAMKLRY